MSGAEVEKLERWYPPHKMLESDFLNPTEKNLPLSKCYYFTHYKMCELLPAEDLKLKVYMLCM